MSKSLYDGLTERQEHRFRNSLASAKIEGTEVPAFAAQLIARQIRGELSADEVIDKALAHYRQD